MELLGVSMFQHKRVITLKCKLIVVVGPTSHCEPDSYFSKWLRAVHSKDINNRNFSGTREE